VQSGSGEDTPRSSRALWRSLNIWAKLSRNPFALAGTGPNPGGPSRCTCEPGDRDKKWEIAYPEPAPLASVLLATGGQPWRWFVPDLARETLHAYKGREKPSSELWFALLTARPQRRHQSATAPRWTSHRGAGPDSAASVGDRLIRGCFRRSPYKSMPKEMPACSSLYNAKQYCHEGAGFAPLRPAAVPRGDVGKSHDAGKILLAGPGTGRGPAQCSPRLPDRP